MPSRIMDICRVVGGLAGSVLVLGVGHAPWEAYALLLPPCSLALEGSQTDIEADCLVFRDSAGW